MELSNVMDKFRRTDVDVEALKELVEIFLDRDRNDDGELVLPKILYITQNLPNKLDQIRFHILLKNIENNRYRVKNILTRLNRTLNEDRFLDVLSALSREDLLSLEQYNKLKSIGNTTGIANIANIIKSSKIGRGILFLPRLNKDLKQALIVTADKYSKCTSFVLKKELIAIIDELLHRNDITRDDYEAIKRELGE